MDDLDKILKSTPLEHTSELNDEMKKRVDELWDSNQGKRVPPSLKQLVAAAAGKKIDPRTKFGRAVREYLASKGRKPKLEQDYIKIAPIILTDEHKEYILNNCDKQKSVEMARAIFKNENIKNLDRETKVVAEFLKTQNFKPVVQVFEDPESIPSTKYRSPTTFERVCAAVNRVVNPDPPFNAQKLSPRQKKDMTILMNYLRTFRFIHLMNSYETQDDRDLFESSFIRYTYDKPDLTEEEVDQYMSLATDIVISASIQRRAEKLRTLIDYAAESNDPDKQKFSVSLVDAIDKMQSEFHQSQTRQQKLLSDLKGKRSERLNRMNQDNASILNLVAAWKDEEMRKKMIELADKRKVKLEEGYDEINNMDELKARLFGSTREEVLEG